nr:hypothetical protein Iba_chr03bCG1320 [Ipomoea batatas]
MLTLWTSPHIFNDAPVDEPKVQPRRPDLRRQRENMRSQPERSGRRMRAVNQALRVETNQYRHDAEGEQEDDGTWSEDGNAFAIVPVQYQSGEKNFDSNPFSRANDFGPYTSYGNMVYMLKEVYMHAAGKFQHPERKHGR